MKRIKFAFFAAIMISSFVHASTPKEVLIPVSHVYTPTGFDSNDNTEIVVSGFLPNLCHKSPKTKVLVKSNTIEITLTSLKYHSSNPFCPEFIVPIVKTIDLGVLDKGNYNIIVNGKSMYEKKAKINIDEASSNAIDDSVYAGVDFIEKTENSRTIILKGYNPSACYVFDKFEIFSNNKDTLSILPKMKQVSDFCPMKMIAFELEMEVPKELERDKILLHVRSLSGNSVNTLFLNK